MTGEKIIEACGIYEKQLTELRVELKRFPHGLLAGDTIQVLAHCRYMISQIIIFVDEGRIEKAFRWLGFMQGVLWSQRQFTLDDLMNHNKPTE